MAMSAVRLLSKPPERTGDASKRIMSRAGPMMISLRSFAAIDAPIQLLIGRGLTKGIDYDREVGRVKVSIKEVVPDFILPKLSMALEIKLAKTDAKARQIVDEIYANIQSYGKLYSQILFVAYDLGTIRDVVEFTRDLQTTQGVEVIVVKH